MAIDQAQSIIKSRGMRLHFVLERVHFRELGNKIHRENQFRTKEVSWARNAISSERFLNIWILRATSMDYFMNQETFKATSIDRFLFREMQT